MKKLIVFLATSAAFGGQALADTNFDRQVPETFSGPQWVRKSPKLGADGKPAGVPEDQLVLQPEEIRTWSHVYLYKDGQQLNEFFTIDIRQKKETGQVIKKICNHFVNPVSLGKDIFTFTVIDVGHGYDPSCTQDLNGPVGPRRVVIEWKTTGSGSRVVDRMVWANFIAGASSSMMVYVDFVRTSGADGDSIDGNIVFPAADSSTDALEARHSLMRSKPTDLESLLALK